MRSSNAITMFLASAALVVVTACGARTGGVEVDAQARPEVPTIALVGDSISEQSRPELERYGDERGFRTDIDATSGFMTREKQDAAVHAAANHPDAAVIALGTNDAVCRLTNALISGSCRYPGFTIADMDADLARMADTLRQPGTCVVGVTVYFGEEVGQQLDVLLDSGRIDGIVDWRSAVNADDTLRADGIGHLTHKGERAFAQFVIDETARICGF